MSKLYIITGPAGVGKSTISKNLAELKNKSVLIEGDEIYHQVIGGYISPWMKGNHLDVFWKVCIDVLNIYLENGYDVIFNYIINPNDLKKIKEEFNRYDIKFVVLFTNEETLLARDRKRPEDCRMNERCIVLLNSFKNKNYDKNNILDTTDLSVEKTIRIIEREDRFTI